MKICSRTVQWLFSNNTGNKEALVTAMTNKKRRKLIHMCKSKGTAGMFMSTVCLYDLSLDSLRAENNIAVIGQCHPKVFL